MERGGWIAWALAATLIGGAIAANGFQLTSAMVNDLVDQSRLDAPERAWYFSISHILTAVGAVLVLIAAWSMGYGWAKVRAKGVEKRKLKEVKPEAVEEDEEDRFALPPGFGERRIKTKRAGAAPLAGFTVLSLLLIGAAGAILFFGILTLIQTTRMDGLGLSDAVLFAQLIRFAGVPLAALGGALLGLAWGRWFPLGELEVIEEQVARERAGRGATWNREL